MEELWEHFPSGLLLVSTSLQCLPCVPALPRFHSAFHFSDRISGSLRCLMMSHDYSTYLMLYSAFYSIIPFVLPDIAEFLGSRDFVINIELNFKPKKHLTYLDAKDWPAPYSIPATYQEECQVLSHASLIEFVNLRFKQMKWFIQGNIEIQEQQKLRVTATAVWLWAKYLFFLFHHCIP